MRYIIYLYNYSIFRINILYIKINGGNIKFNKNHNILISIFCIFSGVILLIYGFFGNTISFINLGIAIIIIGVVIYSFIPSNLVNVKLLNDIIYNNVDTLNKFVKYDNFKEIIFIPPYENLPYGGVFLSKINNANINLGAFDMEVITLNQKGLNGMLLAPTQYYKFTDRLINETKLINNEYDDIGGIEIISSILKSNGLKNNIEIIHDETNVENDNINNENRIIKIKLSVELDYFNEYINEYSEYDNEYNNLKFLSISCPICATVINTVAKLSNQLILVENIEKDEKNYDKKNGVIITIKKLGHIDNYLW